MHLFLLFSWIVLFPHAYTLKCKECITDFTGKCSNTEQCPSETDQCVSLAQFTHVGHLVTGHIIFKSCAPVHLCVNASFTAGLTRQVITSKCCNSDLCNDQPAPALTAPRPNGKKCIACDRYGHCNWELDCVDNEDYCFSAAVNSLGQKITRKGCTTADLCSKAGRTELLQNVVEVSCCQGDYCNSASTTAGSLLLLVVMIVSLVIPL